MNAGKYINGCWLTGSAHVCEVGTKGCSRRHPLRHDEVDLTEQIADVAGFVAHALRGCGPCHIEERNGGIYHVSRPPHVVGGFVDDTTVRFMILTAPNAIGPNIRGFAANVARMHLPPHIGIVISSKGRG